MAEFLAYQNGQWLPNSRLAIPYSDAGFVLGTTVAEQLRTFAGRLFRLDDHLDRLWHSLEIVDVEPPLSRAELASVAQEVIERNWPNVADGDDLGLGIFITPGTYTTLQSAGDKSAGQGGPQVGVYAYQLPFYQWAEKFTQGESIVISDVEQVSPRSWPPELKCRSRMHYYLADLEARRSHPGSRAILLDHEGKVSEATTANLVMYRAGEGLISPPIDKILPGISLTTLKELAQVQGLSFVHRDIEPGELVSADELLLCSTSICVLPAVQCNGKPIADGEPGTVYRQLLSAWGQQVGVDIAEQAERFALR